MRSFCEFNDAFVGRCVKKCVGGLKGTSDQQGYGLSFLTEVVRVLGWIGCWRPGWRKPLAIHDPAKVVTDLEVALGLGGDCLAGIGLLRADRCGG